MKKFIDGSICMTRVATPFSTFDGPVFVRVPERDCAQFAMSLAKFRDDYMHQAEEVYMCLFAEESPLNKILYEIFGGNALKTPEGESRKKYRRQFLNHWIRLCIGGKKTPKKLCIEQGISVESISWRYC